MKSQMITHVWLHPVKEKKVVEKYQSDPGWIQMSFGSSEVEFISKSPVFEDEQAVYLQSKEKH